MRALTRVGRRSRIAGLAAGARVFVDALPGDAGGGTMRALTRVGRRSRIVGLAAGARASAGTTSGVVGAAS